MHLNCLSFQVVVTMAILRALRDPRGEVIAISFVGGYPNTRRLNAWQWGEASGPMRGIASSSFLKSTLGARRQSKAECGARHLSSE